MNDETKRLILKALDLAIVNAMFDSTKNDYRNAKKEFQELLVENSK